MSTIARTADERLGGGDVGCQPHNITNCDMCATQAEPVTIESLQSLLREARHYVYDADVPYPHLYDDQQSLLERIDAAAPPPAPPAPRELCDKEPNCILDKGHAGDCDDMPF